MKEFDNVNKKIYLWVTVLFMLIMLFGVVDAWMNHAHTIKPIIETTIVSIISIFLIIYPKRETFLLKTILTILAFVYFYAILFLYPDIILGYYLVWIIPICGILFFNIKNFQISLFANIIFHFVFLAVVYHTESLHDDYDYILQNLSMNIASFLGVQGIIFLTFIVNMTRMNKIKQYHERLEKIAADKIEYMAYHDHLTDLLNRTYFNKKTNELLENNTNLCMLVIDLDNFKKVNDNFGHDIGDMLIKEIASRIKEAVRKDKDYVARMGGDEFTVLITEITNKQYISAVAERIISAIQKSIIVDGVNIIEKHGITASIGISISNGETKVSELLKKADIAMYEAKGNGKNQYKFYEPK